MKVCINAGVCGFQTKVQAETDSSYQTKLHFDTNCPHVKKMASTLETVNAMDELFKKGNSQVMARAGEFLPHITCPVPAGTLKAVEASAGMALKKDVTITFTEE